MCIFNSVEKWLLFSFERQSGYSYGLDLYMCDAKLWLSGRKMLLKITKSPQMLIRYLLHYQPHFPKTETFFNLTFVDFRFSYIKTTPLPLPHSPHSHAIPRMGIWNFWWRTSTFCVDFLDLAIWNIIPKQDCILVGCILPTCCPYLPACTVLGVCLLWGCLVPGGCLVQGVPGPRGPGPGGGGGGCLPGPGGVCLPLVWEVPAWSWGVYPSMQWDRPPCEQNHRHV